MMITTNTPQNHGSGLLHLQTPVGDVSLHSRLVSAPVLNMQTKELDG